MYGIRFYRTVQLIKDGKEFHLVDILDDASSYFAFGKLCTSLNLANQVVIDKSISRSHWKLAKTQEDLAKVCGVSVDTLKKIMKKWKKANAIAKVNINGSVSYAVNPLYYSVSKGYQLSLPMINAFYSSIREQIKSPKTLAELDFLLSEYNSPVNARKEVSSDAEAQEILTSDITEEANQMRLDGVFIDYVMQDRDLVQWHAKTWIDPMTENEKTGYFIGNSDENTFFTPNTIKLDDERGHGRCAKNCIAVNNVYVDIDAGKDANGHYYDMEEVSKRKAAIMDIIRQTILTPTAIVETRNGFHLYWSIDKADQKDIERGKKLLKSIVKTIPIADSAASDLSRLLRVPGSVHHKEGLEPFTVRIVEATPVSYTMDQLETIFANSSDKIAAACAGYRANYPDEYAAVKKAAKKVNVLPKKRLAIEKPINGTIKYSDAIEYIKSNVSMVDYLTDTGFDDVCYGDKFCCVLPGHDDYTGDAVIYPADRDGQDYDRYVCHCTDARGLDIIDLVCELYGHSFGQALKDLASYLGLVIVSDDNAA